MKNIDMKSLLIGGLLASTIFFGVAATSPTDKWDNEQQWDFHTIPSALYESDKDDLWWKEGKGWELFSIQGANLVFRKRVK